MQYGTDQDLEQPDDPIDLWANEDSLHIKDVPEDLWSDCNMERQPDESPEWVDMLANEMEISRLLAMEVLIKEENFPDSVQDSLTTKFVHDWRAKGYELMNLLPMVYLQKGVVVKAKHHSMS